jgi:hypothetical protein
MESIDINTHAVAPEATRVEALNWVVIPSIVLLVCLSTTSFVPVKKLIIKIGTNHRWSLNDPMFYGLVGV